MIKGKGQQYWWLVGGYSMVVTWWIVAFMLSAYWHWGILIMLCSTLIWRKLDLPEINVLYGHKDFLFLIMPKYCKSLIFSEFNDFDLNAKLKGR